MENRFAYARRLIESRPWDFCMLVDMAIDRLHHAFWRFCDPHHPAFEPGNRYENAFRDFYRAVDAQIGELLSLIDDDTAVMVVSDHGAKAMEGGVCVNQWLMREGLLALETQPEGRARIEDCAIDWTRTKVWSSGGYYARMFFNVAGRESKGQIPAEAYEAFRDEMVARIESMTGPDGQPLGNRALKPETTYAAAQGVPPDLIVYWGDLRWRSVGSVGYDDLFTFENDIGPDDANHDFEGIFIMNGAPGGVSGRIDGLTLDNVAPTMLSAMGCPDAGAMPGKSIEEHQQ
jgi:predicted AlkP superfamily phosphohydrolase/phosphomutase